MMLGILGAYPLGLWGSEVEGPGSRVLSLEASCKALGSEALGLRVEGLGVFVFSIHTPVCRHNSRVVLTLPWFTCHYHCLFVHV